MHNLVSSKQPFYRTLYFQVLFAIAAGVLLGALQPALAIELKPLGDAFIRLIKMIIAPIILLTVTVGVAQLDGIKQLGRIGVRALLYFEIISNLALLIGLCIAKWLQPGAGFNVDPATLDSTSIETYTQAAGQTGIIEFLLNIIPVSIFDSLARGDILSVLLFSVLLGTALAAMGERAKPLTNLLETGMQALFGIVHIIMKFSPVGAFGAMAFTIGKYGIASLAPMAELMFCFYLTCVLFITLVLGFIARISGFSLWRFLRFLKDELLIVLGTSSSESVMPRLMEKLQRVGCHRSVVGLVIPAGYSFNLDGTNIYMTMAALFIAQATNTELTLSQQLLIVAVAAISSNGAAGVTGSGFITLAATLSVIPGIPVAGMVLILGIDRFMSEARALTNVIGNSVATIAISKWLGQLDHAALQAALKPGKVPDA